MTVVMGRSIEPSGTGPVALELVGITKSFSRGRVEALSEVNLSLGRGEILGLVGANGAGKSTLIRVVSGDIRADAGRILVEGLETEIQSVSAGWHLGVGVLRQELDLVPDLTVGENIYLGAEGRHVRWGLLSRPRAYQAAAELLSMVGLDNVSPSESLKALSRAEQQLVAAARALRGSRTLLLLDEPTTSLTPKEAERLFDVVREVSQQGVGVIFISHRLHEVAAISHRVIALRDGRVVGEFDQAAQDVPRILDAISPGARFSIQNKAPKSSAAHQPWSADRHALLSVEGLEVGSYGPASLDIGVGEIVGLFGLAGAGQSEIAEAICGVRRPDRGTISIDGSVVKLRDPRAGYAVGLAYVPADRRRFGIFSSLNVLENVGFRVPQRFRRLGIIQWPALREAVDRLRSRLGIVADSLDQRIASLSGGNQQKCVIARHLLSSPRVLVLNDPTQGVDVKAKADMLDQVKELAEQGTGVLLVSSDGHEFAEVADRVLVMRQGCVVAELPASDASEGLLTRLASGIDAA